MRRFYVAFPIQDALHPELSWTHYRPIRDAQRSELSWTHYTRQMTNEGDNPPIGIVLCADKSDTLIEFTLPEDNKQIFAAKYLPYMPTKEELKKELNLEEFKKWNRDE